MQIAKNTVGISPVNTSGVFLVGSVILYAGLGDEEALDAWCTRHALGVRKEVYLAPEQCDIGFTPTTRGKNTIEIDYAVGVPLQSPAQARMVAARFAKVIAIA